MRHCPTTRAFATVAAALLVSAPFAAFAEPVTSSHASAAAQASSDVRLFIATNGVALSQFPSASRLSTSVTVGTTQAGVTLPWLARSDSPWLTVTSSGATGGTLTLQADPTGLEPDTLYTANVVVATPKSSTVQDTERIRVSFWKGSTDPAVVEVPESVGWLVANPVEPLAYVGDGGPTIRIYNVYSGALIHTLERVAPSLGPLVVSSDGTKLLTIDTANFQIVVLDARSGQMLKRIRIPGPIPYDFTFAYARPGGNETFFSAGLPAIDLASGRTVSAPIETPYGYFNSPLITASADGTRLAVYERGSYAFDTFGVSAADGQLTVTSLFYQVPVPNAYFYCDSIAMPSDGSRIYTACGALYGFDWRTAALVQSLPLGATNALFDSKGALVGATTYGTDDVYIYSRRGYVIGKVAASPGLAESGQATGIFAASGDSTRVISATDPANSFNGQMLVFRTMP